MNCKFILLLISLFLLTGCNQYNSKDKTIEFISDEKYKNSGFALIYNDDLKKNKQISKKIDNRSLLIFHKTLKKDSFVKITNPLNEKKIIAKVVSNNVKFSEFYNSVITLRIAEELSLDFEEPFIELILISQNSTFIAKKAKTFEEEKNVAEKAPVDGIEIDNLGTTAIKNEQVKKDIFIYSIKIADFYYRDSANNMIKRIENETSLKNSKIKKISNTKYRVLIGPFDDIKSLKNSFEKMKPFNFENLEILRNV